MPKSTKSKQRNKPSKPYPDFPLFPHASGRWAKKIRGKLHYFGYWNKSDDGDWQKARDLYKEQREDLYAGRPPRDTKDGLTVGRLCAEFLESKKSLLNTGEIVERTYRDYFETCERIADHLGKRRLVDDLAADDFKKFRNHLSKSRGLVALGNEIQRVRSVFRYGYENDLIEKPIRFGTDFVKPSKKSLRKARNENGKRMFQADELRCILDEADQPLKAMILLGLNCGFGQSDLSNLPLSAVDLDRGWIDYPRPKTGVERRCPLWPETVEALREAIEKRPKPRRKADAGLVFVTKYGHQWVKTNQSGTPDDAVGKEFTKLLKALKLKRPGISFYALRHTFETIGGESRDQVSVNHIMGHADQTMAGVYREHISDERLKAVTETIHAWLWPDDDSEKNEQPEQGEVYQQRLAWLEK